MKNMKLWDLVVWNQRLKTKIEWKQSKLLSILCHQKKHFCVCMYKMVDISVEKYTNAKVRTIRVSDKKLLWVRMYDVQEVIGVKNMPDLVRKEIRGIFRTKNPTKDQIRKYKRREKELDHNSAATFVYVRSDLMSRIIKNCRWKKKRQQKNKPF